MLAICNRRDLFQGTIPLNGITSVMVSTETNKTEKSKQKKKKKGEEELM